MALSDLQVFSEFAYSGMTELQAQQVALFNAATRQGLLLHSAPVVGDFSDMVTWAKISGLVRRRDAYGSGAVSAKDVTQLDATGVKVAAGMPPVNIPPSMMKWIQRSPEEAGVVVGKQLAQDSLADMLNTAILGFVAAIGQITELNHDGTAGVLSLTALTKGASKFGDRSSALVCWVMHSKSMFDLYGAALAGTNLLFRFGDVQIVQDGFGRPLIMSDSPHLLTAGTPDHYSTMGLVPGGVDVAQNDDYTENIIATNGQENIQRTMQAEWSYNLRIQGFQWDKTNGGKSPNDAAIGSSANWDRIATSHKDMAGVLITTL